MGKTSTSTSNYDFSFDPGIVTTGYCIWRDRELVGAGSIHPPKGNMVERLGYLSGKVSGLLKKHKKIGTVIVEQFEGHVSRHMLAMMKCSEARAVIITASLPLAEKVMEISKQRLSKETAKEIAEMYGLQGNEHIYDAFILGVIGGIANFSLWRKK